MEISAEPRTIAVMVVDDQHLVRRGLRTLIEIEDDIDVVAEATDGVDALRLLDTHQVDVALVDAQMPRMDGPALIAELTRTRPDVAAILLTTFEDEEVMISALRAGARGHLLKDVAPEELLAAVRQAHQGRTVLGRTAAEQLVARVVATHDPAPSVTARLGQLSEREQHVARHVAAGRTNREIARLLFITEGTVKNHVSATLRKLDLRDRTALAIALHAEDA